MGPLHTRSKLKRQEKKLALTEFKLRSKASILVYCYENTLPILSPQYYQARKAHIVFFYTPVVIDVLKTPLRIFAPRSIICLLSGQQSIRAFSIRYNCEDPKFTHDVQNVEVGLSLERAYSAGNMMVTQSLGFLDRLDSTCRLQPNHSPNPCPSSSPPSRAVCIWCSQRKC